MKLYRIVKEKYAHNLQASGYQNRWNEDGQFVIYTSGSRSLACLENLVHRSHLGKDRNFKLMVIEAPHENPLMGITGEELPNDWKKAYCGFCLKFGSNWYRKKEFLILKTPSSIIPDEFNYLINTTHTDFFKVRLIKTEEFVFDGRLK